MASLTNLVSPVTDFFGLTDSQAGARANRAMHEGQEEANQQLDSDLAGTFGYLNDAMAGRTFGQNLDQYQRRMSQAQDKTGLAGDLALGQKDAGSSANVREYLNPMMDEMLADTTQAMQGTAGSALQSSAANRDTSRAVAQQAGHLWNTAFNQALGDAQTNLGVAQSYGKGAMQGAVLAGQEIDQANKPMEDFLNLKNDLAMQRYAANTGMTQANMAYTGTPNTIL